MIIIHNFHCMLYDSKGGGGGSEMCLPAGGSGSEVYFHAAINYTNLTIEWNSCKNQHCMRTLFILVY